MGSMLYSTGSRHRCWELAHYNERGVGLADELRKLERDARSNVRNHMSCRSMARAREVARYTFQVGVSYIPQRCYALEKAIMSFPGLIPDRDNSIGDLKEICGLLLIYFLMNDIGRRI